MRSSHTLKVADKIKSAASSRINLGSKIPSSSAGGLQLSTSNRETAPSEAQEISSRYPIAAAACANRGLGKRCREIEMLKVFRDTFMVATAQRRAEAEEFQRIAPEFVQQIKQRPDKKVILNHIFERFIVPAANAVEAKRFEEAYTIYIGMLSDIEELLLTRAPY